MALKIWAGLSTPLCFGLVLCFWLRPDGFAAVTIFPVWCWFLGGLFLTVLGWRRNARRSSWQLVTMWWLFLLLFADEPRSLLRSVLPASSGNQERELRVVSLNCSGGDPLAGMEVAKWQPDVVLLQESPSRADVQEMARKLFGNEGDFLWGVDASILTRGNLKPRPLSPSLSNYFVQALVQLPRGKELEVFSLRLITPPFRIDVWSPECWRAYAHNHQLQRTQMDAIEKQLLAVPIERAVVVGGDFNAPQGDAIFGVLRPRLRDCFMRAGRGWGNTIINEFPALRIDQIWASNALVPRSVRAGKTVFSDHRAVIADFLCRDQR